MNVLRGDLFVNDEHLLFRGVEGWSLCRIIAAMPLIRCQKCGQTYDVPPVIAVKLPGSVATCVCGEWLAGSKAALLARFASSDPDDVKELDLKPYRVAAMESVQAAPSTERREDESGPFDLNPPRSLRLSARSHDGPVDLTFTLGHSPLWIGRKGSHLLLDDADLSIRHCSISLKAGQLIVSDADSYAGTFLDGQQITEAVIEEGVHLLRLGSVLVTVEPVDGPGNAVEPIEFQEEELLDASPLLLRKLQERGALKTLNRATRAYLVCVEGPLKGKEFEVPAGGLVVGREGTVLVPDEFLSRKHFEVFRDAEGVVRVRDLGSRNGTFLNTLPARNTTVEAGDEIRAGVNRFRIDERV